MNLFKERPPSMKKRNRDVLGNESGMVLVLALIMMIVLTLIGLASTFTSTFEIMLSGEKRKSTDAFYAADSAVNSLILRWANFNPKDPQKKFNYDPYTDPYNTKPPNLKMAEINFDPNKIGPPRAFSATNLDYAYFWIESVGSDSMNVANPSTTTINLNVVRLLPKDESTTIDES